MCLCVLKMRRKKEGIEGVGVCGMMWLYQVPSTGCRCGLRFLFGLLINHVCVRVHVCVCQSWDLGEEPQL